MAENKSLQEINKLIEIYQEAQQGLIRTIAEKEAKGNVTWFQESLLEQIRQQLDDLSLQARQWTEKAIPMAYQEGLDEVTGKLNKMGVKAESVSYSFSQLHTEAVYSIMQDILDELQESNQYAGDQMSKAIRMSVNAAVAQKFAQGQTVRECKKNIVNSLMGKGVEGILTKNGRIIPLEVYAATVARSRTREATNTATINQITDLGYDLVKISKHNTSCRICAPLQGRVYSISGNDKRYPPLSIAFRGPYANIHANCAHTIEPYIEELADDPVGDREFSNKSFDTDTRSQKEVDLYNEMRKRKQQLRANRRQWERYSLSLPESTPKSFQGFMNMKRSDSEQWQQLQEQYKNII